MATHNMLLMFPPSCGSQLVVLVVWSGREGEEGRKRG